MSGPNDLRADERPVPALIALCLMVVLIFAFAGCGNDAEVSGRDTGSAEKINMPDGFDTVATKCSHGNRVYVNQTGSGNAGGIAVVPHDPTCPPR